MLPSMWLGDCGEEITPREPLAGDVRADVAVVGAGFTGLWTAHHLLRSDPSLRVVILEREFAGWGASGRNGGWCFAESPTPRDQMIRRYGADQTDRLVAALRETVDAVGRFCSEYGVDADYHKGGSLNLARGAAQVRRLRDEEGWIDAAEARRRVNAAGVDGATFDPHCAVVHPAKLVRGLARVVEQQGATIHEGTEVQDVEGGVATTLTGRVRADVVVRATEAYTAALPRSRRLLAPIWSQIVATEPLDDATWAEIGWTDREALTDARHLVIYSQRTRDGRIVFGGRGAPYRFGSSTASSRSHLRNFGQVEAALRELFPQLRDTAIAHRWSGVLGVPRDWMPSVGIDRMRRLAWAGGYVGEGVACSALAGRILAGLILDSDGEETTLPWVGHSWRRWEPEPLRWMGIRGMTSLIGSADRAEARTGRPARRVELLDRLTR